MKKNYANLPISHNKKYVLLPLIESDRIIEWKRAKDCSVIYRKTLLFTEKSKINKILKDNNFFQGGWYIWTDYSDYCGMAKITELNMFNFNFNFSDEHSGNGGKEKCKNIKERNCKQDSPLYDIYGV